MEQPRNPAQIEMGNTRHGGEGLILSRRGSRGLFIELQVM